MATPDLTTLVAVVVIIVSARYTLARFLNNNNNNGSTSAKNASGAITKVQSLILSGIFFNSAGEPDADLVKRTAGVTGLSVNEVLQAFDRRRSSILQRGLAERAADYAVSFPIAALITVYGVRSVDIPSLYGHAAHIWQIRNNNADEINADLGVFVLLCAAASIASIVYEAIQFHHVAVVCLDLS